MGEIKYKKNKYYFIPNIQEDLEDLNGEKAFSWLIFKGEKYPLTKNKYKIKEGDIFKLARMFFIVRGIHIKEKKIEQKDTNCLISYHSKINQSLNINEDYIYQNTLKNIPDNGGSDIDSNTDISEENESEEEEKVLKISKIKNKEKKKNSKNKSKKKNKRKEENLINEVISVKTANIKQDGDTNQKASEAPLNTNESKKSEKQKICRICYMSEIDSNFNPLIKPCKCSGSMKYIHFKCLLHWLKTKIQIENSEYIENEFFSIYSPENIQCELCKEYFPHFLKHNNKLFNLTELEQDFDSDAKNEDKNNNTKETGNNILNDSYVVLDSMSPDKEIIPYRYIVKFPKDKILKIGRGLDMNLILNDLSVSRNHCQLELTDNGDIFLKDNNSKFGTLVLVQSKSVEILKGQILTIQAGRTYFNIQYKSNNSFFNCCNAEEIDIRKTYEKINYKSVKLDKNSIVLTEEVSDEGEEEDNNSQDVKDEEDVKEENEYENSIKNLNNKKIKLMKISRKNKKKEKTDTSINIHKENIESNIKEGNLTKVDILVSESKKERSKFKKKSNKSLDNKENENNNKKKGSKNKSKNNNNIDNKEEN